MVLHDLGIPSELIYLIKLTKDEVKCSVQIQGDLFTKFNFKRRSVGPCMSAFQSSEKQYVFSGIQTAGRIFDGLMEIFDFSNNLGLVVQS